MTLAEKIGIGAVVLGLCALGTYVVVREPEHKDSISVTGVPIEEQNFTGEQPYITGTGPAFDAARTYVEQTVTAFKESADAEVPELREEFGDDVGAANYSITLTATYVESSRTETIVIEQYEYRGGANGMSTYHTFSERKNGETLLLKDVVRTRYQEELLELVKGELLTLTPEGAEEPVTTPEYVAELTLDSLSDWSFSKDTMTFYFDKYEVGAGALGAVALPIPLERIQRFLAFVP